MAAPREPAGHDLAIAPSAIDHARGAERPAVTIVEYGDFECPMCRQAEPAVQQLLLHHPTAVRLVFRHYPIESAHPHALLAAEAAEAAGADGKFWEMHDLMLADGARLRRPALEAFAERLGLDMPRFTAALDDEVYRQRIREHIDGAVRSHVRATPAFFVDGVRCDVSGGMQALSAAVLGRL
jgi:protein-disulfide isomerase